MIIWYALISCGLAQREKRKYNFTQPPATCMQVSPAIVDHQTQGDEMEHMAKVIMAGESLVGNTGLLGYLGQYNGT